MAAPRPVGPAPIMRTSTLLEEKCQPTRVKTAMFPAGGLGQTYMSAMVGKQVGEALITSSLEIRTTGAAGVLRKRLYAKHKALK